MPWSRSAGKPTKIVWSGGFEFGDLWAAYRGPAGENRAHAHVAVQVAIGIEAAPRVEIDGDTAAVCGKHCAPRLKTLQDRLFPLSGRALPDLQVGSHVLDRSQKLEIESGNAFEKAMAAGISVRTAGECRARGLATIVAEELERLAGAGRGQVQAQDRRLHDLGRRRRRGALVL